MTAWIEMCAKKPRENLEVAMKWYATVGLEKGLETWPVAIVIACNSLQVSVDIERNDLAEQIVKPTSWVNCYAALELVSEVANVVSVPTLVDCC